MALYSSLAPSHLISSIRENTHARMHHTKNTQSSTHTLYYVLAHTCTQPNMHSYGRSRKKEIGCTYLVPRGPKSGTSIPQSCYSLREGERDTRSQWEEERETRTPTRTRTRTHTQWEGERERERVSVYVLFQEVHKKIHPLPSKAKSSFLVLLYRFDHFEGMQEKKFLMQKKYSWVKKKDFFMVLVEI